MLNKWKTAAPGSKEERRDYLGNFFFANILQSKTDDYPRIEDDLWDCFTFLDDYLTILEDSFLRDIRDLDESEFSIPEVLLVSIVEIIQFMANFSCL